ncbi:MAG: hypothetical protein HQK99_15555 [Nitrospirae bacterium]|nr:hypothetical protein [Nitrospirota bacterium]
MMLNDSRKGMNDTPSDEKKLREEYFKTIEECAKGKINFRISNGSVDHAAYLLKSFFEYGNKRVFIFTGQLRHIFDNPDMIKKACEFLKKHDSELTVAYADKDVPDDIIRAHPFIKGIIGDPDLAKKFRLFNAKGMYSDHPHFALMDNSAYRLESDHHKSHAIANFGDIKTVQRLDVTAKAITENSMEISL